MTAPGAAVSPALSLTPLQPLLRCSLRAPRGAARICFENIKDSEKMLSYRAHGPEVQAQNKRNLMQHNNSTQTDIFYADRLEDRKRMGPPGGSSSFLHKSSVLRGPFSVSPRLVPARPRSLSSFRLRCLGSGFWAKQACAAGGRCCPSRPRWAPVGRQRPPWTRRGPDNTHSGGTWPKAVLQLHGRTRALFTGSQSKENLSLTQTLSNAPRRPQNRLLAPRLWACPFPLPSKGVGPLTPPTSQER